MVNLIGDCSKGGKKLEDFSIATTQKKTTAKKTLGGPTKAKR